MRTPCPTSPYTYKKWVERSADEVKRDERKDKEVLELDRARKRNAERKKSLLPILLLLLPDGDDDDDDDDDGDDDNDDAVLLIIRLSNWEEYTRCCALFY